MERRKEHEVIVNMNDHWIVLAIPVFEFLTLLVVVALFAFAGSVSKEAGFVFSSFFLLFAYLILLFSLHRFLTQLIEWELSSWIITTDTVIDFDKKLFSKSEVIFIDIDQITEIERIKKGFLANLLDYGDILIFTPASADPMVCDNIPHPGRWTDLIKAIQRGDYRTGIDVETMKGVLHRKLGATMKTKKEIR